MRKISVLLLTLGIVHLSEAQQSIFTVTSGDGNGVRFWGATDNYKIHMGNSSEYHYGPVQSYSIKMNMYDASNRGWTWGVAGQAPKAALSTAGTFQIDQKLISRGVDVYSGNGNGIRFWASDHYKIHMGSSAEYKYGPVTDYSIKMNMSDTPGRGWTWGVNGAVPVAALNTQGKMKVAGSFEAGSSVASPKIETPKTSYTKIQLATHDWSGSHAILFNSYKDVTANGGLNVSGNTKYANNQGNYGGGAAGIFFNGNGGTMDINISPAAGASGGDTNVTWGTPKMRITRNGEVGIGTTNVAGYKLSVAGKVRAEEVKVELASTWPDYVFEPNYELRSLEEIEKFIKSEKHLPEVPSSAEVEENGIALGEMNALLLKKIEELTLHTIKQQKQLEKQGKLIDYLLEKDKK